MPSRPVFHGVPSALALTLGLVALHPRTGSAQTKPTVSDQDHRAAFDYLLGDWEFTGERQGPNGKAWFKGYWSATRTPDNRTVVDEFRVVDDQGKTLYVTTTLRAFHPTEHRWSLVSIEATGLFAEGSAWKDGDEMKVEQSFGGKPLHFRYYEIGSDHFSWVGSSPDQQGKYVEFQWIQAKRVGPPRPGVIAVRGQSQ